MTASRNRVVPIRNVDLDFVDNSPGAVTHDEHAVGQGHGFEQIVSDQQGGFL